MCTFWEHVVLHVQCSIGWWSKPSVRIYFVMSSNLFVIWHVVLHILSYSIHFSYPRENPSLLRYDLVYPDVWYNHPIGKEWYSCGKNRINFTRHVHECLDFSAIYMTKNKFTKNIVYRGWNLNCFRNTWYLDSVGKMLPCNRSPTTTDNKLLIMWRYFELSYEQGAHCPYEKD